VQLQWNDNAGNETRQTVYMAQATNGFVKVADLLANQTSYSVQQLVKGQVYSFRVTAANAVGESSPSNVASAIIPSDTLQAAFRVSPVNGVVGVTTFSFVDQSSGPVARWLWEFGDGSSSTTQNPTHVYTTTGLFTITLTVYSATNQQHSTTHSAVVTRADAALNAEFSYTPVSPSVIDSVSFVDESTGPVATWSWNFGDNETSSEQNASHRYALPGTYDVKLTVSGNGHSSTITKAVKVASGSGGSANVDAAFDFAPTRASTGEAVVFHDGSSGLPNSWFWQFGDGSISTQQHPTHVFSRAGTFNVTLTAGNLTSSSATTHAVEVVEAGHIFRSLIPVAAETEGSGGFRWRTELTVYNGSEEDLSVTLRFLPASGLTAREKIVPVPRNGTTTFPSALQDLFGTSAGSGAILVEAVGTTVAPNLRVTSRTFTNSSAGTYGQSVGEVAGAKTAATTYITGIVSNAAYRSNIGLVNASNAPATATLTLLKSDGTVLDTAIVNFAASLFQQTALTTLFPAATGSYDALSLRIVASAPNTIFAYASVIDNRTQDPVYIPASAQRTGRELVVPAVARVQGNGGTFWRSDVFLYNPSTTELTVDVTFLRSGTDNSAAPVVRQLQVAAGRTEAISDITSTIGAGDAVGAVLLRWGGEAGPIVTSRTYTDRASDHGTYGQSIDPVAAFASDVVITGLQSDGAYRTNVGFVNNRKSELAITATLLNGSGAVIKQATLTLPAQAQTQVAVDQLFGLTNRNIGSFTVRAQSASPDLFAYGSVVDNASGDPIFVPGR
jgi:PKD repeat protein